MSELKVNEITGLGGTVKINDPVGMGAVARSGYQLNTNGKINVEGSVEVVTVPASNFGVRIRAPINSTTSPGFGDSTLQFTNNQGTTEWASIHAKSDASLDIRTDGDSALTINNAQTINHLGASLFNNTATFNNLIQVNGQAIFANTVVPRCGGAPTLNDHLANKIYVDGIASNNVQYVSMSAGASAEVSKIVSLKSGLWVGLFTSCVGFGDVNSTTIDSTQTASCSGLMSITNSHLYSKTGGGGHGRSIEATATQMKEFRVSLTGNYTFQIGKPSISWSSSRGATLLLLYVGA